MIQEIATHSRPIIFCYFEEDQQCHPERFQERITRAVADGTKYGYIVEQATEKSCCERYCATSGQEHALQYLAI